MLRLLRLTWLPVALAMPLTHAAAGTVLSECTGSSQAAMRTCLEKKSQESLIDLAQAEKDVYSALARWDEDPKYLAFSNTTFKQSHKSFIQFRQAQCAFAASLGGGAIGNAIALRQLACQADLNRLQATSLRAAVAALPQR